MPPAGSYDPSLDSQLAAARRGLADLQGQIGTQQARDVTDYGSQVARLGQQQEQGRQDLTQQYQRGQYDLANARGWATDDFNRNVALLARQYEQKGRNQLQATNQAGVIRGGALLQSAAKRAENQAIDRQPIDTNYQRFLFNNTLQGQRMTEDYGTQSQRLNENADYQQGQLALDLAPPDANNPLGGRRYQDRTTQLTQAQREQAFFGQDVMNQKIFQASGSGWDPQQRPSNEFVSRGGTPYRVVGGVRYDQFGRRLGRATGKGF